MATVLGNNQVKLNSGQVVQAQENGWYDGQNYSNGQLGTAGVKITAGVGQGQAVSQEVNRQTSVAAGLAPDANQTYIQQQQNNPQNQPAAPAGGGTGGFGAGATPAGGVSNGGSVLGGAFGSPNQPALNLPGLYDSLSKSAGISDMQAKLTAKEEAFNKQQSVINNDPYLSESERTGRGQKLSIDYNNDIKTTQDALTMAKQDVQTQLDLQTKQFDINSQQAKQALDEFNTLLSSGALAGASGADVAAITAATGISSGEIQAAISSQSQKDTPTSVQIVDDGTNQYAVTINSKTGAVISKSVLAASAPKSLGAGAQATQNQQQYAQWAGQDAKNGATLQSLISTYSVPGGLTIDQIYQIYAASSKYGAPKETLAQVKAGNYATQSSFTPDKTAPGYTAPSSGGFNIFGLHL